MKACMCPHNQQVSKICLGHRILEKVFDATSFVGIRRCLSRNKGQKHKMLQTTHNHEKGDKVMTEVMKVEQETTPRDEELDRVSSLLNSALLDLAFLLDYSEVQEDDIEILMWVWESIVESAGILLSRRHSRSCDAPSTQNQPSNHSL